MSCHATSGPSITGFLELFMTAAACSLGPIVALQIVQNVGIAVHMDQVTALW